MKHGCANVNSYSCAKMKISEKVHRFICTLSLRENQDSTEICDIRTYGFFLHRSNDTYIKFVVTQNLIVSNETVKDKSSNIYFQSV